MLILTSFAFLFSIFFFSPLSFFCLSGELALWIHVCVWTQFLGLKTNQNKKNVTNSNIRFQRHNKCYSLYNLLILLHKKILAILSLTLIQRAWKYWFWIFILNLYLNYSPWTLGWILHLDFTLWANELQLGRTWNLDL